ncbi:unnamed protein product [Parajaminaea phylloscopi]
MFSPLALTSVALLAVSMVATGVQAGHQVIFESNCKSSILQIPGQGNRGPGTYNFEGDVKAAIASGGPSCSQDGNNCPSVEFTLNNGYSTGDITLIPPHKSTSKASFTMLPGGSSATCNDARCGPKNAFFKTDDYGAQRYDKSPNAGIHIVFRC